MNRLHRLTSLISALFISMSVLSATEVSADKEQKVIIGWYDDNESFQYGSSDEDIKSGYAYEYLQELAVYTGREYEYRYGSFSEILGMLKKNEIDMTMGISEEFCQQELAGKCLLSPFSTGTENAAYFDIPGAEDGEDFYIAVASSEKELYSEISDAQKLISIREPMLCAELSEKYFLYGNSSEDELSFDEKNWLSAHSTVRIGYLDNYMPYSDKNDDKNSADGAMVPLFSALNSNLGKSISAVKYTTYAEMYSALESDEIDAVFPAYRDLNRLEKENIVTTRPLISDQMLMISKDGGNDFSKIAVLSSSPVQPLIINDYWPDAEILHFNDISGCLKAVRKGTATSFVIEQNIFNYYLSDGKNADDLDISESAIVIEYCFATKKSNSALCRLLGRTLSTIGDDTVENAVNENLYKKNNFTFIEFFLHNIVKVLIIAGTLTVIAILLLIKNKTAIKRKQSEVDEAHREKNLSEKEKKKYREKTEKDLLTGVYSRGHFIDEANKKMNGHRPDDMLQLVMMDIDNFKSVNDTYGHDNGDVVLRRLGEILKEIAKVNGFAGRFGGEEFFIFLYGDNTEIQEHIITQVCRKLRETDFDFTDRHITISVGVTLINEGDTLDDCIERADKALYYSKNHGKNQVNHFEDIAGNYN